MNRIVDINSDLGESFGVWTLGDDPGLFRHVTSGNVACGFHAGDPQVMLTTLRLAKSFGVAVGAHPGYPDLPGFGRRAMACSPDEVYAYCLYQIGALAAMCRSNGIPLCHVKPHGALYNESARDRALADAIASAVRDADPGLILMGMPATMHHAAARYAGVAFAAEFLADRAYMPDGSLVPRSRPDAVLSDVPGIVARVLRLVTSEVVETVDGSVLPMHADSICVHGDTPGAVAIAEAVRLALGSARVTVVALRAVLQQGSVPKEVGDG
jgi:UPF0271 protein